MFASTALLVTWNCVHEIRLQFLEPSPIAVQKREIDRISIENTTSILFYISNHVAEISVEFRIDSEAESLADGH